MTTKNIHENIWKKIDAKEQSGDNKKNDWHMNYDLTMRLLGYYNSEEQIMHVETRFPEEAVVLADLFRQTFEKTFTNEALLDIEDEDFTTAYYGNTVFIIRDRAGDLYAYYPRENRVRLSGVSYGKSTIHF